MKRCPRCKKTLDKKCFYKDKSTKDGLTCYCKDCQKIKITNRKKKTIDWYKNYQKKYQANYKNLSEKNLQKYKARYKLYIEIKKGEIKKESCIVCGDSKSEGHHKDYSKPLHVVWLCRKHHIEEHKRLIPRP
jgi:DNA-directed RNA polymerase beta' subunit